MLDVEQDLLLLSVVSDEGVQRVAVGHPADQARVGGQGDDGVALDAEPHNTHINMSGYLQAGFIYGGWLGVCECV